MKKESRDLVASTGHLCSKQDKHYTNLVNKMENEPVLKRKIKAEDKKLWDCKSKTAYLEK